MSNIPTPHIKANLDQVAKTVLMPGDPLRAKFIAETFLENYECVNTVRNMLGFTGEYKGKKVSVFGSGMGMPSIGIYSYELFNFYGVENIIRIGTAGTISDKVNLRDVAIGIGACTDSNFAHQYNLPGTFAPTADFGLARAAVEAAEKMGIPTVCGNILSSDVFYDDDATAFDKWRKMGVLAVEMEAAALYMNAARAGKKALCMLTISDDIYGGKKLSVEDRQTGFTDMMKIALEVAAQNS
ncbi:MAG: purine-nucleoside phosphorylase [Lachnospiraceae bacterium]|nr:purine-nucleoside phosphorylase [Lachnospiraceae bacterium]